MSTINVDNIAEYTSAGGVTIDGAVIKDGKITGGAAGLTLITSGSVSTVTGITLDNVFTSTFPSFLLTIVVTRKRVIITPDIKKYLYLSQFFLTISSIINFWLMVRFNIISNKFKTSLF